MKKNIVIGVSAILIIVAYGAFLNTQKENINHEGHDHHGHSHDHSRTVDSIHIFDSYAFATAASAKSGAAFMVIENLSNKDDALIEAQSDVAEITEIHENLIDPDDGMMMMRKVKRIDIAASGAVALTPTGYHIMLINLKQPLKEKEVFQVTLKFESGYETIKEITVMPAGQKPSTHMDH